MSEKISIPYKFSKHEHTIIGSYFSTHTDWEKSIFDDIKSDKDVEINISAIQNAVSKLSEMPDADN